MTPISQTSRLLELSGVIAAALQKGPAVKRLADRLSPSMSEESRDRLVKSLSASGHRSLFATGRWLDPKLDSRVVTRTCLFDERASANRAETRFEIDRDGLIAKLEISVHLAPPGPSTM